MMVVLVSGNPIFHLLNTFLIGFDHIGNDRTCKLVCEMSVGGFGFVVFR